MLRTTNNNEEFDVKVPKRLRRKRPHFWANWLLRYGNAASAFVENSATVFGKTQNHTTSPASVQS